MTRLELVIAKAARVRARLERIRSVLAAGREAVVADEGRVEQIAFNVLLAIQECVDLASHVVADERWGAPATLAEVFDILERHAVLSAPISAAMRRGTKLRNLIAHGYGGIDPAKLHESAVAGLGEIEEFLVEVLRWADGQSAAPSS